MCTSVYNVIEDCYKTSILPAAIHLKTAGGSLMSLMGKAMLHLCIADFKFSHIFITCDKIPETDFLSGIDLQIDTHYLIAGTQIDNYSYREKTHS